MKDSRLFIDTNILVYAHDNMAGEKHIRAKEKIKQAWELPCPPALSVQVLQELYINLIKKKIEITLAQKVVGAYFCWEVIKNDLLLLNQAFEGQKRWKISFWDALIVAAANKAKAGILWSEDLNPGQRFDRLEVVNPLNY